MRISFEPGEAAPTSVSLEPEERQDKRTRARSEAKCVTHRIRSVDRAAALLIAEHGPAGARDHVRQQLSAARRARSRIRHEFWTRVGGRIAAAAAMGGN
jgi:hypothetical protein